MLIDAARTFVVRLERVKAMTHFLADTVAALLGGLLLTTLLFWLGERVFPIPQLSGKWFVQTCTTSTARRSYEGMLLKHEILILQEGATLRGTSEKIYESSSTGRRQYDGVNRARGTASGVANRYIFSKDRVRLHVEEAVLDEKTGRDRVSTTYFDLVWERPSFAKRLFGLDHRIFGPTGLIQEAISGLFQSTAASRSGKTLWSRNRYDQLFDSDVRDELSATYGAIVRLEAEAGLEEPS